MIFLIAFANMALKPEPTLCTFFDTFAAIFITVLSDVYAFSFGLSLVPVATGLPVSSGLSIYLLSVVCGQLAMSLLSGFKHASSGAAYELAPLLVDIALTVTPFCESSAAMASTLLVANALTSALVGSLTPVDRVFVMDYDLNDYDGTKSIFIFCYTLGTF